MSAESWEESGRPSLPAAGWATAMLLTVVGGRHPGSAEVASRGEGRIVDGRSVPWVSLVPWYMCQFPANVRHKKNQLLVPEGNHQIVDVLSDSHLQVSFPYEEIRPTLLILESVRGGGKMGGHQWHPEGPGGVVVAGVEEDDVVPPEVGGGGGAPGSPSDGWAASPPPIRLLHRRLRLRKPTGQRGNIKNDGMGSK